MYIEQEILTYQGHQVGGVYRAGYINPSEAPCGRYIRRRIYQPFRGNLLLSSLDIQYSFKLDVEDYVLLQKYLYKFHESGIYRAGDINLQGNRPFRQR